MQFSNDRDGKMLKYTVGTDFAVRSKKVENYFRKAKQKRFEEPKAGTSAVSNKKLWTAGLLRYAKYNMNVFFCPSDERELDIFKGGDNNSSYTINYGDKDRPGGKEVTKLRCRANRIPTSSTSVIWTDMPIISGHPILPRCLRRTIFGLHRNHLLLDQVCSFGYGTILYLCPDRRGALLEPV